MAAKNWVIKDRLTYGRNTPWQASKRERKRGRDLTWTLRGMPTSAWVMENWPGSAPIQAVRCKGDPRGQAPRCDPLLRLEFANWSRGSAAAHA